MPTGLVQYALLKGQSSYDTPIAIITGGSVPFDVNAEKRAGIAGVGVWKATGINPSVRIDTIPVDESILTSILRDTYPWGLPPDIDAEFGSYTWGIQSTAWKVNTAEVVFAVGAALTANYDLMVMGKPIATVGALTGHADCPQTTFECSRGLVQLDDTDCSLTRLTVNVRNNLNPVRSLNERAEGYQLYPEAGEAGVQEVECSAELLVPIGVLSGDDDLTVEAGDIVATAVNDAESPATVTLTVPTPKRIGLEFAYTDNNTVEAYTARWVLDDSNDGITIAVA